MHVKKFFQPIKNNYIKDIQMLSLEVIPVTFVSRKICWSEYYQSDTKV